jgi:cytochrome c
MSSLRRAGTAILAAVLLLLAGATGATAGERYGFGRPATQEQIAGWDIDVRPDGQGLPAGQGTAAQGEAVFMERCAVCHGEFGEAFGRFPPLLGGFDTFGSNDPVKTVGSYWPYASTLWDYIYRAMPFGDAQSLSLDEVYALTAFLLYINGIVEEDFVLDRATLPAVDMPNREGFFGPDPRPDVPLGVPCMKNCRTSAEVASRARMLDVTPETGPD